MTEYRNIVILPAEGRRRSRRMVDYLRQQQIPFTEIPLASPEGQALMQQHDLRASPGILGRWRQRQPLRRIDPARL